MRTLGGRAREAAPRLWLPVSRRGRRSCCFVGLLLGEGAVVHLNPPADDAATCAYQFSGATKEGQDADYGEHVAHAVVSPGFSEHQ